MEPAKRAILVEPDGSCNSDSFRPGPGLPSGAAHLITTFVLLYTTVRYIFSHSDLFPHVALSLKTSGATDDRMSQQHQELGA